MFFVRPKILFGRRKYEIVNIIAILKGQYNITFFFFFVKINEGQFNPFWETCMIILTTLKYTEI